MRTGIALAAAFACAWFTGAAKADTGEDRAELERTFEAARIYRPAGAPEGSEATTAAEPRILGVIVYAHGCDGLSRITDVTGRFLAEAGYIVVAPDGFARLDKPTSCEPANHRGSLHRAVLNWRHAEVRNAVDRIGRDPALASLPLFLMGHSEGAITVATIGDVGSRGRIVEGWTCHAGWPEYHGLNLPADEPVLSLVGENDPWFQIPVLRGDCGAFMGKGGHQRSLVYRAPSHLYDKHWLSSDRDVQREILGFLDTAIKMDETKHDE